MVIPWAFDADGSGRSMQRKRGAEFPSPNSRRIWGPVGTHPGPPDPGPIRARIALPGIPFPEFRAKIPYFRTRLSGSRCLGLIYGNRGELLGLFCRLLLRIYLADLSSGRATAPMIERRAV